MSEPKVSQLKAQLLRGAFPPGAELVSERILRRVLRVETEEGVLYAKQHLFPFLRVRLRYALRPSPSAREAQNLARAAARGVLVPRVLAERSVRGPLGPKRAVLLTAALPEGQALDPPARRRLLGATLDLAAKGIYHPDLHGDNLRLLEDGQVAFLDFQSCRFFRGPLPARLLPSMLAPLLTEMLQTLPQKQVEAWLREKKIDPVPALAAVEGRKQQEQATRLRHALRNSTKVQRSRPHALRHPTLLRLQRRGSSLPQAYDSAGLVEVPGLGPCLLSQALLEGGARVLKLQAQRSLRPFWLRAVLLGPQQGSRILAWDRNIPWFSRRECLYILHQEGVQEFPMGGDDVASLLSRLSPPWPCS
ncbi:MAG TPA: hypothetical protein ENK02_06640 [Planctomycetes bacterium]|nr:hypothetical protein [Planctomycetota bacterium]